MRLEEAAKNVQNRAEEALACRGSPYEHRSCLFSDGSLNRFEVYAQHTRWEQLNRMG